MFTFSTVLVISCFYKCLTVSGFIATGAVYIPDRKRVYLYEIKMRCWLRIGHVPLLFSFHITKNPIFRKDCSSYNSVKYINSLTYVPFLAVSLCCSFSMSLWELLCAIHYLFPLLEFSLSAKLSYMWMMYLVSSWILSAFHTSFAIFFVCTPLFHNSETFS